MERCELPANRPPHVRPPVQKGASRSARRAEAMCSSRGTSARMGTDLQLLTMLGLPH